MRDVCVYICTPHFSKIKYMLAETDLVKVDLKSKNLK